MNKHFWKLDVTGSYGYKDVNVWKRPSEFDTSKEPNLYGDNGVLPSDI